MKGQIIFLALIVSLTSAIPVSKDDSPKEPVKRGIFDSLSHFPFLASSSSAHGSSSSSSSSSDHKHDDHDHDFHSHVIHHQPEYDHHHQNDFLHDDNVAISYQNQYFGHNDHHSDDHHSFNHHNFNAHSFKDHSFKDHSFDHHSHEFPTSYHEQHFNSYDGHTSDFSKYEGSLNKFEGDFNKYDGLHTDSLLESSHLDAPEYGGEYKNYGGDLGLYSQNAGYLDISDDHKIDNLLDPYYPSHSSYDSY